MIRKYFKIGFRNVWKYKAQSLTALLGLAFGLACFTHALYWLRYETSFDHFYPDSKEIYRIYTVEKQSNNLNEWVPGILRTKILDHFPEVAYCTGYLFSPFDYTTEKIPFISLQVLFADSTFLKVFPQWFVSGDAIRPLHIEQSIILTQSVAIRLFGDVEGAIGQQMKTAMFDLFPPFTVTAVVKDPPPNSNVTFEAIHNFPLIQNAHSMPESAQWDYFNQLMYVKLHPRVDVNTLSKKLLDYPSQINANHNIEVRILPIAGVRHRFSIDLPFTLNYYRLFVVCGALLLFCALFNFVHLYIDIYRKRFFELRNRALHGAKGGRLILQMMVEMIVAFFVGFALAFLLLFLTCPISSQLLMIPITVPVIIPLFAICGTGAMVVIMLSSLIPFYRLSRRSMRYISQQKSAAQYRWRNSAVMLQITISVIFVVVSLVVMMQMRFVNRKDLGFNHTGILQVSGFPMQLWKHRGALLH